MTAKLITLSGEARRALEDRQENTGARLIKEVGKKTNDVAGARRDGLLIEPANRTCL